jgi:UDPglucose 6-dehydrogenase
MANTFFATKISFLNDMKLLSDKSNANWNDVIDGFVRDGRIGHSHLNVPGHDGKYGFGGVCFPKDIQAIIHFADTLDIDMAVLKGAWETNLKVRPEKDWEEFKGRAVSDQSEDQ